MNADQFNKILHDYGWIVLIIVCIIAVIGFLAVIWKPLSKFVEAVNTILTLPATLQKQDEDSNEKKVLILALDAKLTSHLTDFNDGAVAMATLQQEVRALGQQQIDIIHEVKPNSGSSMNDSIRRTEKKAAALEDLLLNMIDRMDAVRSDKAISDVHDAVLRREEKEDRDTRRGGSGR